MADESKRDESVDEAVAAAEALARAGSHRDAALMLIEVLAAAPERVDVRVRRGLSALPTKRSLMMLDLLNALAPFKTNAFVAEGLATWMKVLPFLDDARFMEVAERHEHLLPMPNWHWNLQTMLWAVQQAENTPGDFVELGVFRGHTTMFLADYLDFAARPRTWWLYDTFAGIPEDQLDPGWEARNERTYRGTYGVREVVERFAGFPNIKIVQGRVPEVLKAMAPEQIAFLHVDLNNSAAEIAALDLLFDRIPSGGVIVLDDYCWEASRAQHDAEKAWFAARGLHILPLPTGQGVFVKP